MSRTIRLVNPLFPRVYTNRITVIKAIRNLTGLGLKEAKDITEASGPQILNVGNSWFSTPEQIKEFEDLCTIVRNEGGEIGPGVQKIIQDLRELGVEALRAGEDELANEILQLVLAEKLRRKDI